MAEADLAEAQADKSVAAAYEQVSAGDMYSSTAGLSTAGLLALATISLMAGGSFDADGVDPG